MMNNSTNRKPLTVVIPTKNSGKSLEDCLKSLQQQTYKNFDILIVDGYSTDNTVDIAKKFKAKVVYDDGKTRASACNKALEIVGTPYIAFTDDDAIPFKDWVEKIVKFFESHNCVSVGGINFSPPDDSIFAKSVDVLFSSKLVAGKSRYGKVWDKVREINHNPGCNVAYKTSIIRKIGFDEDLPTAEDVVLDYKIKKSGGKIYFSPDIKVYHRRRNNLKSLFKQIYKYGLGRAIANKRYKELKSLLHILPTITLLATPLVLCLLLVAQKVFMLLISIYILIILLGNSLSQSPYKNIKTILIATFLANISYLAWAIGYLKGVIKND